MKRRWARQRFALYSGKRKCLDRFFGSMAGDGVPTIAWEAASFAPTGRGERAVPTTAVARRCAAH